MNRSVPRALLSLSLLATPPLTGCSRPSEPAAPAPKTETAAEAGEAPAARQAEAAPKPQATPKPAVTASGPGERALGDGWIAAGQPSQERVKALAEAKVPIISLRTPGEDPFDEATLVERLGGAFSRHPTTGAEFTQPAYRAALFDEFDRLAKGGGPVYVHCASSNRVGAAWALYLAERKGLGIEEALQKGREAGMRSLDGLVRSVLAGTP